jgi:hypothetical protein
MPETGERRKHRRLRVETRVDLVYKGVNGYAAVRSANLAPGGAFVVMSQPPAPGTVVFFGLMVGNYGHHRGQAEVVWARPAEQATEHPAGCGLRFVSFAEGSDELVGRFVEESYAAGEAPTGHGEERAAAATEATVVTLEVPAVSATEATVITPLELPAAAEPAPTAATPTVAPAVPVPPQVPETGAAAPAPVAAAQAETPTGALSTTAPPTAQGSAFVAPPPLVGGDVFAVDEAQQSEPATKAGGDEPTPVFDQGGAAAEAPQPTPPKADAPPAVASVVAAEVPPPVVPPAPPAAAAEKPPAPAAHPSPKAASAPTKPRTEPAAAPEKAETPAAAAPEAPAPTKPTRVRRARPRSRRSLLLFGAVVIVGGGLYLVATQTPWGRAQASRLPGLDASLQRQAGTTSRVGDPADHVNKVAWTSIQGTTVITVTANGRLAPDRVVVEEFAKPPRSRVRVRGIARPYDVFQEKSGLPNVATLRVVHYPELVPPELVVVVEPSEGATVTGVKVDGRMIVIQVSPSSPAGKSTPRR